MLLTEYTCIGTIDVQNGKVQEILCVRCAMMYGLLSDDGRSTREAEGTTWLFGSDITQMGKGGQVPADTMCSDCGIALLREALDF